MTYKTALLISVCAFSYSNISYSQIGIGTTNPSAELEIATTNTGVPALELNPQTLPVGTANGQLAVIGDELFIYDLTRAKWLSMAAMPIQFGRNGNVGTQTLHYGGNMVSSDSGPLMLFNGTIVGVTGTCASGNDVKDFQLRVMDYNPVTDIITNTVTYSFSFTDFEFNNALLNLDFNTNDFFTIRARNTNTVGDVLDPAIVIWVKWRK